MAIINSHHALCMSLNMSFLNNHLTKNSEDIETRKHGMEFPDHNRENRSILEKRTIQPRIQDTPIKRKLLTGNFCTFQWVKLVRLSFFWTLQKIRSVQKCRLMRYILLVTDKHHKVSSFLKRHQNKHKSGKYEVL